MLLLINVHIFEKSINTKIEIPLHCSLPGICKRGFSVSGIKITLF